MLFAIIVKNDPVPAICCADTEIELLDKVGADLGFPPNTEKAIILSALSCRPRPSGLYRNYEDALGEVEKTANPRYRPILPLQPDDIKKARTLLNMTRVEFGQALGFNGNPNTLNKAVYELETDFSKSLNRERQETLFALIAQYELKLGRNFDGHRYAGGGYDPDTGEYLGPEYHIKIRNYPS